MSTDTTTLLYLWPDQSETIMEALRVLGVSPRALKCFEVSTRKMDHGAVPIVGVLGHTPDVKGLDNDTHQNALCVSPPLHVQLDSKETREFAVAQVFRERLCQFPRTDRREIMRRPQVALPFRVGWYDNVAFMG
jgi:hypothetical protein